ncbi:hypothetical protein HHX47_DHR4000752 [Lentinula edodes]|nr:hypothetical protein HHX47_DHR4000752 [Lentinula edodes]
MSIYNIAPIISLLHRSLSHLKRLSINTWLQEDKLLDLLHCALIATHLEIREHVRKPIITDEVLQTLNIPSASDSAVFLFPTGITGRTILLAPPLLLQHQILLPALVPALDVEPAFKDDIFDLFSEADAKTKRARLRKFSLKRATGTIR